jgi:hypothetical protein
MSEDLLKTEDALKIARSAMILSRLGNSKRPTSTGSNQALPFKRNREISASVSIFGVDRET